MSCHKSYLQISIKLGRTFVISDWYKTNFRVFKKGKFLETNFITHFFPSVIVSFIHRFLFPGLCGTTVTRTLHPKPQFNITTHDKYQNLTICVYGLYTRQHKGANWYCYKRTFQILSINRLSQPWRSSIIPIFRLYVYLVSCPFGRRSAAARCLGLRAWIPP